MKRLLWAVVLLTFLAGLTWLQSGQLRDRPLLIKLGPAPEAQAVALLAGRQKPLLAWWWTTRVVIYFGSLVDMDARQLRVAPEYFNMYKTIEASTRLDPYNMDAYYFAQAAFTWEVGRVREVNALLLYGMDYRDWDYQLPFFAGFNAAYFLHDYAEGARLMQIAAERSGNVLFTNLAARYFHQAHQTDLGIAFLTSMLAQTRDEKLRNIYQTRLAALQGAQEISRAVSLYRERFGRMPVAVAELQRTGLLATVPVDPYGGTYYLEADGSVMSSSRFAFKTDEEPVRR